MRKWIDILKESSLVRVYHGSNGYVDGQLKTPLFTTTNYEMANSYAKEKGRENGVVYSFLLDSTAKIATIDDVENAADKLRIDWEDVHVSHLLNAVDDFEAEEVISLLRDQGFSAAFIHDFGFHSDFAEEPTYVIFDLSILSDEKIQPVDLGNKLR